MGLLESLLLQKPLADNWFTGFDWNTPTLTYTSLSKTHHIWVSLSSATRLSFNSPQPGFLIYDQGLIIPALQLSRGVVSIKWDAACEA